MAKATPELATKRDRQLLALTGGICVPASFALFHTIVLVNAWADAAPALVISGICATLTTMPAVSLVSALLARRLQVHNQRMRVALNNMSQGCACSRAMSG